MKSIITSFIFVGLILLSSCKERVDTTPNHYFQIKVVPLFNGEEMELNTGYTGVDNVGYKFERIAFFATNLNANNNGATKEGALFNFEKNDYLYKGKNLVNDLLELQFFLGVNYHLNHQDPTVFGNDEDLNIANVDGLHWGWDPGYIFIAVEGKADTLMDGQENYDHSFVYHVGKDVNLRSMSFTNVTTKEINDSTHCAYLYLEMHDFFYGSTDTIHVNSEHSIHEGGQMDVLAQKALNNFEKSLTK
ncbi:MbnP family protein [Lishizhenia sp.]|uniref:MbnP family protein n=1 Tax=Lishizhenia sp. TaxID=2497594 RepID=UPI00299EA219|nr:MbnP family protein [Lishizhenia sp.]MDX1445023.1 MbnP family protein [Lishizhenia sp.]